MATVKACLARQPSRGHSRTSEGLVVALPRLMVGLPIVVDKEVHDCCDSGGSYYGLSGLG